MMNAVTRVVHVPYAVEQDEDGVWCASAQLRPGVGAVGDGPTQEAAIADLREALEVLLAETGPPDELTLTLNVAGPALSSPDGKAVQFTANITGPASSGSVDRDAVRAIRAAVATATSHAAAGL